MVSENFNEKIHQRTLNWRERMGDRERKWTKKTSRLPWSSHKASVPLVGVIFFFAALFVFCIKALFVATNLRRDWVGLPLPVNNALPSHYSGGASTAIPRRRCVRSEWIYFLKESLSGEFNTSRYSTRQYAAISRFPRKQRRG